MASLSNEHVPVINKKATIIALSVVFLVFAWITVIFRLYARFRLSRAAGPDDLLVVLAAISVTIGSSFVVILPDYGLGHHVSSLLEETYQVYLHWFWAATLSYFCSTTLIKVSLLLQYLRLFEKRSKAYFAAIGLTVIISVWGLIYVFLLAFACSPVEKFWSRSDTGTCFGFGAGSSSPSSFFAAFASHSAFNLVFDILVFSLPILALSSLQLQGKSKYSIAGLVILGATVIAICIARLAIISKLYHTADPTWLAPAPVVLSCLEVDVAILCASIPIFWPLITTSTFGKIFVVDEVIVHSEERAQPRPSSSGSETELRIYESDTSGRGTPDVLRHYKDPYVVGQVRPVGTDDGLLTGPGMAAYSANVQGGLMNGSTGHPVNGRAL